MFQQGEDEEEGATHYFMFFSAFSTILLASKSCWRYSLTPGLPVLDMSRAATAYRHAL